MCPVSFVRCSKCRVVCHVCVPILLLSASGCQHMVGKPYVLRVRMLIGTSPSMLRNSRFSVKIHAQVLRFVTPCSFVVGYHRFRGPCCLHLQGEVTSD
jgi:hypothetical protein